MRVLVVVNGDAGSGPPPLAFDRIVAADGGALLCRRPACTRTWWWATWTACPPATGRPWPPAARLPASTPTR